MIQCSKCGKDIVMDTDPEPSSRPASDADWMCPECAVRHKVRRQEDLREWLKTRVGGETHVDTLKRFASLIDTSGIQNAGEWAWWLEDLARELQAFIKESEKP